MNIHTLFRKFLPWLSLVLIVPFVNAQQDVATQAFSFLENVIGLTVLDFLVTFAVVFAISLFLLEEIFTKRIEKEGRKVSSIIAGALGFAAGVYVVINNLSAVLILGTYGIIIALILLALLVAHLIKPSTESTLCRGLTNLGIILIVLGAGASSLLPQYSDLARLMIIVGITLLLLALFFCFREKRAITVTSTGTPITPTGTTPTTTSGTTPGPTGLTPRPITTPSRLKTRLGPRRTRRLTRQLRRRTQPIRVTRPIRRETQVIQGPQIPPLATIPNEIQKESWESLFSRINHLEEFGWGFWKRKVQSRYHRILSMYWHLETYARELRQFGLRPPEGFMRVLMQFHLWVPRLEQDYLNSSLRSSRAMTGWRTSILRRLNRNKITFEGRDNVKINPNEANHVGTFIYNYNSGDAVYCKERIHSLHYHYYRLKHYHRTLALWYNEAIEILERHRAAESAGGTP